MIVSSSAFTHFYDELYEKDAFPAEADRSRRRLLRDAALVGRLRLWSLRSGGILGFKGVDAGSFLNSVGRFDFELYASHMGSRSSCSASVTDLIAIGRALSTFSNEEIACGHDLTSMLDYDAAGRQGRNIYGAFTVEKMLRLSFDSKAFLETKMAEDVLAW